MSVSCTVSDIFSVKLEIWVIGHSRSFKMVPYESCGTVSYSHSIVTMALSRIISEIKRNIGRKWRFLRTPHAFDAIFRGSRRNIVILFGAEN